MFRSIRRVATPPFPSSNVTARAPGHRAALGARLIVVALSCMTLASAASCGGDQEGTTPVDSAATSANPPRTSAPGSTTSTSAPATDGWSVEQQEVIDDFLAARAAFSESLANPDPTNPTLEATHVDPMLTEVRNINAEWQGFGQAGRFPDNSVSTTDPLSVDLAGDQATVETCGVDDSVVYDIASGNVLNDDVMTVRASSTLQRVDGVWKLATRSELERWEGVAGCAVEQS